MAKQTSSTRSRYVQIRSRAWRRMVITVSAFLVVIIGLVSCKSLMPESDSSLDLSSSPGSGEFAGKIGVEASIEFVDRAKLLRQFERIGGGSFVPTDENGYPLTDAQTVIFDDRPIPAWAPPIDDPSEYQPDASGTYKLLFNGQATIGTIDGENINITNQNYDANTNTTIADVTLASNTPALMILTFTNTKRTPTHESNTGITNLKLIRPGYASDTTQLFTDRLLSAYQPFSFIRFMGVTNTNYDAGFYGDPGHHIIEWNERSLPSDASQQGFTGFREGKKGLAWEYLILLANTLNKDVWINIPVSASGVSPEDTNSYVYQLASLFKNGNEFTGNVGLKPELNIYLEHSNEVWNYSFSQYIWNKLAAEDEVAQGRSTLNNDGVTDPEVWARRRHAKRLYEVAKIFETVYGSGSLGEKIRPVYAHWTIFPEQYIETLTWMNNTYGTPGDYFWGLAQTHYFNDNLSGEQDAVQDVLRAMRTDSEGGNEITLRLHAIAQILACIIWRMKPVLTMGVATRPTLIIRLPPIVNRA
ncbi:MAG: hypothetical protein HC769_19265 [Cyanobacteria bacterium CRU_2_1]|nr:hypothetical protein [Cyanobacteria bacterium CRU_2_1]